MHKPLISSELVDDFIIVRAASFTARVQRAMTRGVLRDEGLPVLEWRLLFSVARFGTCHMAKITQQTSIDPAHGSRAVAALERKGLITRSPDPKNARRKLISLTEDGEQLFGRIWPQARATIRRITDQLDPADFAAALPDPAIAELPGVRRSLRPQTRPARRAVVTDTSEAAINAAVKSAVGLDVDPDALSKGTRLAQLGAFESAGACDGQSACNQHQQHTQYQRGSSRTWKNTNRD